MISVDTQKIIDETKVAKEQQAALKGASCAIYLFNTPEQEATATMPSDPNLDPSAQLASLLDTSIARQRDTIVRHIIDPLGLDVIREYVDQTPEAPQFMQLLDDARTGNFKALAVWDFMGILGFNEAHEEDHTFADCLDELHSLGIDVLTSHPLDGIQRWSEKRHTDFSLPTIDGFDLLD